MALSVGGNNASTTYSGALSGGGSLNKAGNGTLTLNGANTYTGGTTVNAGVLAVGNNSALGAANSLLTVTSGGAVNLAGFNPAIDGLSDAGTLGGTSTASVWSNSASNLNITPGSSNTHYGGTISGPIAVTVNAGSGGKQILSGNNTYTGGTTLNGYAAAWSANALGAAGAAVTLNDGGNLTLKGLTDNINYAQNLTVNGNSWLGLNTDATLQHATWSGTITLNSGLAVCPGWSGRGVLNISGCISGSGTLNVTDTDTLVLSGSNTYTGNTKVSAGTLSLGNGNALAGSTLDYNNYGGVLSFGTLTSANLGGLQGGQNLALTNASSQNVNLSVGGNDASTAYGGVLSGGGSFTKVGMGTLTLSGANSYTGGTTVNAGVLALGNNSALGAGNGLLTVTSGGAVNLAGFSPTVAGLSDAGTLGGTTTASVWSSGASNLNITPGSSNVSYGGTISGPVTVTVNAGSGGKQILSGNNTYTGGTTVNGYVEAWSANALGAAGASVTVNGGAHLALKGLTDNINYAQNLTASGNSYLSLNTDATLQHPIWSGTITLNSGATLSTGGGQSSAGVLNITGGITGSGALAKVDPGTVILSGNNTYTGNTTVNNGTLVAETSHALSANSDVTVNGGTLDVSGYANTMKSVTLSSGTLDLGIGYVLTAAGAANFNGGTIALSGPPATLGKYKLVQASSAIGTVSSATSGVPANYHVSANGSELDLTHYATFGSISATPSSTQIIVGGSTPVSVTVGNSAPVNSDSLLLSLTAGSNMSGFGSGTAAASGDSGPVSGLSFTGSAVGAGQTGSFTVSDPNATNKSQPGSVSVNVLDHSNASFSPKTNQMTDTIDFGNVLKGAVVPSQSLAIYNRAANTTAAYTANLKLTGSTASGDVALNAAVSPFGGLSAGGYVTYAASLNTGNYTTTGTKTVSMSASQLADDSTLSGAGNNNNGAMNIVLQGNVGNATADNTNSRNAFGTALTAQVAKGGSYANLESTVTATSGSGGTGMLGSTATILDGTASAATAVSMAWRTRTTAETTKDGGGLLSDVVSLSGIAPDGTGSHDGFFQTDTYVLQMSYDPSELTRILGITESQAVAEGDLCLKSLNDGLIGIANNPWGCAVDENFGGTPNYVGDHAYNTSYFLLGDYGVDTTNHVVWAVVDYSGTFAAPEPGTFVLLAVGAASLLAYGWRRRRTA